MITMKKARWLLLLAASASAQADVSHLYRVDDHLYRGKQPGKEDYAELARMGIKTVLDLRGGPIHMPHERQEVEAAGMQYVSIRLSGIFPPKEEQIEKILAVLVDPARGPVFLHCRRGDDRSGLVIAVYRVVHDHWTDAQAFREAREQGMSRFEVLMRRYIRHFNPAEAGDSKTASAPVAAR
jgi:tyrosine-protein phosphatase SIW14